MANQPRRRRSSGDDGPSQGGEQRSGPIAGTAIISGATFEYKALQYAEVDGLAIFEGDIILGPADRFAPRDAGGAGAIPVASVGISGAQFRWPDARVPFEIDPGVANQQRITDAIAHWEANTSIRFVQRDASNAATLPDYVRFVPGNGCSSWVGRQTERQDITLGTNCSLGSTIHEIGHAVGLWHEQSREDRDAFVRVEWVNIDSAMAHNFDQHIADGDDLGAYDYGSIMHYPATAFSTSGQATLVPLQPLPAGVTMGQRTGLSAGDIAGVAMMYPATTIKEVPKDGILDPTIKESPKDPIFDPTVKETAKDPISDPTFKEVRKDPISDPTFKEVRKDPISDPTFKEVRKDPIQDPPVTSKETARDPIGPITRVEITPIPIPGWRQPGPGFGDPGGQSPFVIAGASRAGDPTGEAYAAAVAQVQQLASILAQLDQQQQQVAEAYTEAVAILDALGQGRG